MYKRFRYDYNFKIFTLSLFYTLSSLTIFIWSFNENIIVSIIVGICTFILLFNSFIWIFNQGIIITKKYILILDYFWLTKIKITDLKYAKYEYIKKEKQSYWYGLVHEFYHPSTYMYKCDYVYNNGKVYNIVFYLKDGSKRETYFGWMYKEKNKEKVERVEQKLCKFIENINMQINNK